MHAMNNDGLSPTTLAFFASKFDGAIKHHKKTAAAIRFDGIRRKKAAKFGRKRAALERQIVQNELLEMELSLAEQLTLDGQMEDSYLDRMGPGWNGGFLAERCAICSLYENDCECYDDHPDLFCHDEHDMGCSDCGCLRCECDDVRDDSDYDYGYDPDYHYSFTGGMTLTELLMTHHKEENTMTEEDKMKLSDALWEDHEFLFGKNNLRTMTRVFGDEHYELDCGFDDYGFYSFADEPVDEFGGLPNHFDPRFDYRTHFALSSIDPYWDFSVDFDDVDFRIGIHPNKARRASRFTAMPGKQTTRFYQTGWEVVDGSFVRVGYTVAESKVKNLGSRGRTHNYKSYRGDDKDITRMMDKTAAKRAHHRMMVEVLGIDPPKATQQLRFKSMEEKEQYEANQRTKTRRNGKKRDATSNGDTSDNNVDYSLDSRRMQVRMRTREVHVTRIGKVNGERCIISEGFEKMRVRY